MNLYIMSRGRFWENGVETIRHIPYKVMDSTFLVVPEDEADRYSRRYPGVKVMPEPHEMNYSQKMQWLLGLIHSESGKGVIMDDDLWWNCRLTPEGKPSAFRDEDHRQMSLCSMWVAMEHYLEKNAVVGIHPRMQGQNAPVGFKTAAKIITVQGVNTRLMPQIPKVDYDPILADVHLNLWCLSRGIPTGVMTSWFVNWRASQSAGGCDYRTPEMQETAVNRVAEMYGPYAKAVWKKAKGANWLGEDGRWDLRVQWKKIYEDRPNG